MPRPGKENYTFSTITRLPLHPDWQLFSASTNVTELLMARRIGKYILKFLAIKRFVTSAEYMIDRKMIFSYDWDMKIPAALTRKTETLNEKCKCGFQRDELL